MPNNERICAFYSRGPHFLKMLRYLRQHYPKAHLTALVPKGYPSEMLQGKVDDIQETAKPQYALQQVQDLLALRRQIKQGNYTNFVTMFNTPKLQALARISYIRHRHCFGVDARFSPLRTAPISLLFGTLYNNLRGRIRCAYINHIVHHRPVRPTDDEG